jgi:outer membrane protein TolC/anti-anti-sigma regulatory factor
MLKITTRFEPHQITLKVEGKLVGVWAKELERSWKQTQAPDQAEALVVDLTGVTFIDNEGKRVLAEIYQRGGKLQARDCMTKCVVDEISKQKPSPPNPGAIKNLTEIVLLFLLPFAVIRHARAAKMPPVELSLRQAIAIALRQNPQTQIANLALAESEQDQKVARSGLLPQATLDTFDEAQRFNIKAFAGGAFPLPFEHVGPFQVFQSGPRFSVPVFNLRLLRNWQAAHHVVQASQDDATTVREQTVLLVVSQYLDGLRAAAAVKASRARVALARALYQQASDLQKHGVGTGLDTLRANVELQNELQRQIVAETDYKTSLYGLARLLNLNPHERITLKNEMSFFETPSFNASSTLAAAFATRPELKAIEAREQAEQAEVKAAGDQRFPTINILGSWEYQGLSLTSAIPAYTYQLDVQFPLITSGRIRAEQVKARLALRTLREQDQDTRDRITLEVKTALANLKSAKHQVEVANLGVKLAAQEVAEARDRFAAGVANNIEVVTAQDELARANDNQIDALYQYNESRAELARAVGEIEKVYSK